VPLLAWVEQHEIGGLADVEPIHVAAYIEVLQMTAAKPTVKLHLAAIRMLFEWLVVGQVLAVNPAHAVRGPKHVVRRGKKAAVAPSAMTSAIVLCSEKAQLSPTKRDY
jgi:site-specific recombinase XerC